MSIPASEAIEQSLLLDTHLKNDDDLQNHFSDFLLEQAITRNENHLTNVGHSGNSDRDLLIGNYKICTFDFPVWKQILLDLETELVHVMSGLVWDRRA